jgi:hypothetical protein
MLNMLINVYKIYTGPPSLQAHCSRLCPISSSFRYNSTLVTWTVVYLTAAKFKPLILSMSGFSLPNIANIFVIMVVWLPLVACIILLYNHALGARVTNCYTASGLTSQRHLHWIAMDVNYFRISLYALPSNGLFTKNLSPREGAYRAVA